MKDVYIFSRPLPQIFCSLRNLTIPSLPLSVRVLYGALSITATHQEIFSVSISFVTIVVSGFHFFLKFMISFSNLFKKLLIVHISIGV